MSLTIKFILISHIAKHQVKHIFTPSIFHKIVLIPLRDFYKENLGIC